MSSKFDIDRIAHLARLTLSPEEKDRLGPQLEKIVAYIDELNQLDTSQVEPTSHVLPLSNVFRADEERQVFPPADYLAQAPGKNKGHYEVPQIIG
jgi:aspartyl-tRNA(Asn)/glutamyl-tRNA(Gln) amidotransferase subunit C